GGLSSLIVLDVNADDWEKEILKSEALVVVDFWHERCPWCKRLEPVYNEVAKEYEGKVKFAKLNVFSGHENQHVSMKYGVMSTPTLVFFCDGRPVEGVVGFQSKERLRQLVDDMIKRHPECINQSTELKTS
ncbi:MAG: thioredoxin family protein, partial [Candidatus Bathyarchaeota archaeon]|nr:thioredoxin family protein [Candidatus Bathyarchaeota archaeon]